MPINFAGYVNNGKTLYYGKFSIDVYENVEILVKFVDIEITCSHCKKNSHYIHKCINILKTGAETKQKKIILIQNFSHASKNCECQNS